jgi:hypothetical protein
MGVAPIPHLTSPLAPLNAARTAQRAVPTKLGHGQNPFAKILHSQSWPNQIRLRYFSSVQQ